MVTRFQYDEEIPEALKPYITPEKGKKSSTTRREKLLVIAAGIFAAVMVIAAVSVFLSLQEVPQPEIKLKGPLKTVPYVWETTQEDVVAINVENATEGIGSVDLAYDIEYVYKGQQTEFTITGFYNSVIFKGDYAIKDVMRITPIIRPNDGVIDGYIVVKIENESLIGDIFIDEDWRKNVQGTTNIIWGSDWQNIRPFGWQQISKGVYKDTVIDTNISRFDEDIRRANANIAVTNATSLEMWKSSNVTEKAIAILAR
jgi:hypothetical protein